jgi:hypothetical protein
MISEVLASNYEDLSTQVRASTATPFDDSFPTIHPDWIELSNSSATPLDLTGFHLTDNDERPTRWEFPAGTSIPANGYLVVFASGKDITDPALDETGRLHTDFVLSSAGEYVALTDSAGDVVHKIDIPKINRDVSYGFDAQNVAGFYVNTTPEAANSAHVQFVADTSFDHDRGIYHAPFDLTISTATEGATIVYTLDGTEPTIDASNQVTSGTAYSDPIHVSTTTNLRAMAFKDGMEPTNVDTQSYIFPADVLQQSVADIPPAVNWGSSGPDWEMDPEVVNLPEGDPNRPSVEDFSAIPTVSITMDWDDLFGTSTGIYVHGEHIETPMSFEYFDPATGEGVQQDASIEAQGGSSITTPRNWKTDKISMLVRFKAPYGPTTLDFDIFGDGATTSFDQINIDGALNFVWDYGGGVNGAGQRNNALYIHDQVAADVQNAISGDGAGPHGRFVNLYYNGIYWGMYYLHERPDESFGAAYHGGDKDEYHALNQNNPINVAINPDGSLGTPNSSRDALDAALRLASDAGNGGMEEWNAVNEVIDVEHFIDYLMMNWYLGNEDWGQANKNWYATKRNTPDGRWRFHSWDAEKVFQDFANGGVDEVGGGPKGGQIHSDLLGNAEFQILFADRIHDLMFNGGILTEESLVPIFQARVDEVESAIRLESARWGDNKRSTPYVRQDLMDNFQGVYDNFFPDRHDRVLEDLIEEGVYPEISAPVFQINGTEQFGGLISAGDTLTMTARAATVTTDTVLVEKDAAVKAFVPSDNSLETGASRWYDADFDASGWTSGNGVVGFGSDFTARVDLNVQDEWNASQSSVYVRYEFDLDAGFNAADIERLNLDIKNDDGYVAYLNGQEIHRDRVPGSVGFDTRATNDGTNFIHKIVDRYESVDLSSAVGALQPGTNVLAIHGLVHASDLGHLLVGAELTISDDVHMAAPIVYTLDGTDPRVAGGANVGTTYEGPISLAEPTQVMARAFVGGQWSALASTAYVTPASPGDVWISEINYNPHQPTDAETQLIPGIGNDDFEFIELYNSHDSQPINLLGMRMANGVEFEFPEFQLQPNSYAVIVDDIPAFQARYGTSIDILGQWDGRLSNNGETIELVDGGGNLLVDVAYNDNDPWSERADGLGATLELMQTSDLDPATEMGKHYAWQASSNLGGTPGDVRSVPLGVVINEVRASSDQRAGEVDEIELYNTSDSPKDIGGWYLSDSFDDLFKFEIPAGTVMPANSYLTFTEADFNPVGGGGFALRSAGDDVWLVSRSDSGGIETFGDDVHFGGTANSETLGRVPNGSGRLAPLVSASLGAANGAARVGPILISEINYNPGIPSAAALAADPDVASDDLEFVEIHNPTAADVELTEWRIRGGVELDFDAGTMLPAGGTVVALSFNPDNPDNADRLSAFRAHYDIGADVVLTGGYRNQLSNSGERVQLQRPGTPPADEPDLTPRLYEDELLYDDLAPWPAASDGTGASLQRTATTAFGNDAASWRAGTANPGTVDFGGAAGDLNSDNIVDGSDIDFLCSALGGPFSATFDFDGSGGLDYDDVVSFVENTLGTSIGDANLDHMINAMDLNQVGFHWLQVGDVGWATGDFTCDGEVNAMDLNRLATNWQFGVAPQAARAPRAPLAASVRAVVVTADTDLPTRPMQQADVAPTIEAQDDLVEHSEQLERRQRGLPAAGRQRPTERKLGRGDNRDKELLLVTDDCFAELDTF